MSSWNPKRDKEIVKFYLGGGYTLRSLGKKYKLSFQRIEQILNVNGIHSECHKTVKVKCPNCKKIILLHKKEYDKRKKRNKGGKIYCSIKCFHEYRKRDLLSKRIIFECLLCKKEVKLAKSIFKKSQHHFCSRECYYKYLTKTGRVKIRCGFCNKEFSIARSILKARSKRTKYDKLFCSRDCFRKYLKSIRNKISNK